MTHHPQTNRSQGGDPHSHPNEQHRPAHVVLPSRPTFPQSSPSTTIDLARCASTPRHPPKRGRCRLHLCFEVFRGLDRRYPIGPPTPARSLSRRPNAAIARQQQRIELPDRCRREFGCVGSPAAAAISLTIDAATTSSAAAPPTTPERSAISTPDSPPALPADPRDEPSSDGSSSLTFTRSVPDWSRALPGPCAAPADPPRDEPALPTPIDDRSPTSRRPRADAPM